MDPKLYWRIDRYHSTKDSIFQVPELTSQISSATNLTIEKDEKYCNTEIRELLILNQ